MPRISEAAKRAAEANREHQSVLEELRSMSLRGSKAALQVMLDAVEAKPKEVLNEKTGRMEIVWLTPPPERIRAAQYILDQVVGQPVKKDARADDQATMEALVSDIREYRRKALQS
jgi:hypothetical protein